MRQATLSSVWFEAEASELANTLQAALDAPPSQCTVA
jgi:hypothetical protein